jgi:hypothetical protein
MENSKTTTRLRYAIIALTNAFKTEKVIKYLAELFYTVKLGYNKLGYNELGYNKLGYNELGYNDK